MNQQLQQKHHDLSHLLKRFFGYFLKLKVFLLLLVQYRREVRRGKFPQDQNDRLEAENVDMYRLLLSRQLLTRR